MRQTFLLLFAAVQLHAQPVSYPLHVGDTWYYRNAAMMTPDTSTYISKALADTVIGDKRYTAIYARSVYYGPYLSSLERQSGDSVFAYRGGPSKEILYFNFSCSVGDTVSTTLNGIDTMDVVLTQKSTWSLYGASRRIWIFAITFRHVYDADYFLTVADSIGVAYNRPGFGDPLWLVGAVINGRSYGNPLTVSPLLGNLPDAFTLDQNFPNPFNPTTTIRFALSRESCVTLAIYDGLGRIVHHESHDAMPPGSHDLIFDGRGLSSGVYYYRVTSGAGSAGRMMMLVK